MKYIIAAIFLLATMASGNVFAQTGTATQPVWVVQSVDAQARTHQSALEDLYDRSRGNSSSSRQTRARIEQICTVPAEGSGGEAVAPSDSNPCPALTDLRDRLNSGEFVSSSDFAPFADMIQTVCSVEDPTEQEATSACPRLDRIEADISALQQYNELVVAPVVTTVDDHELRLQELEKDSNLRFGITFASVGLVDDVDTGAFVGGGFAFRYQIGEESFGTTQVRLGVSSEGWDFAPAITTTLLKQFGQFSIGGGLSGSLDAGALNESGVQAFGINGVVEIRGSFGDLDLHLAGGPGVALTLEDAELGYEVISGATIWLP